MYGIYIDRFVEGKQKKDRTNNKAKINLPSSLSNKVHNLGFPNFFLTNFPKYRYLNYLCSNHWD